MDMDGNRNRRRAGGAQMPHAKTQSPNNNNRKQKKQGYGKYAERDKGAKRTTRATRPHHRAGQGRTGQGRARQGTSTSKSDENEGSCRRKCQGPKGSLDAPLAALLARTITIQLVVER